MAGRGGRGGSTSAVAFVGTLVAALATLMALLLLWTSKPKKDSFIPDFIENLLEGPLIYGALGLALVASLVAAAPALALGRARRNEVPKVVVDPIPVYRTAVEMAWIGGAPNEAQKERLGPLATELGLRPERAAEIRREVEARAPFVEPAERQERAIYRTAVRMAWADEKLNADEEKHLHALELDLRLSGGEAEEIERDVMGGTREEKVSLEDGVAVDDPAGRYRTAVEMAWADDKLNPKEKGRLSALETGLGLDQTQASKIEREVMGGTREEVVTPDPEEDDLLKDDRWIELVEECVGVVEELDRHMADFDPERQELADHVMLRLEEVLERSGVDIISDEDSFDGKRHMPEKATAKTAPGAHIVETLRPGYAVGRRVLRRARVRVQ